MRIDSNTPFWGLNPTEEKKEGKSQTKDLYDLDLSVEQLTTSDQLDPHRADYSETPICRSDQGQECTTCCTVCSSC